MQKYLRFFMKAISVFSLYAYENFVLFEIFVGFNFSSFEVVIDKVEGHYINHEKKNDENRINNRVSARYTVYYFVGGSVWAHKEHIIIVKRNVRDSSRYAEG